MKNVKIALIGIDGTGKTTIARGLSRLLGIPYFKDSIYKERFFNDPNYANITGEFLLDLLRQTSQPIIMDRCFWDEFVYGQVYNRPFNEAILKRMVKLASDLEIVTIYCYKDTIEYKDDLILPEDLPLIKKAYEKFLIKWGIPNQLWLNTTDQKIDEQLIRILKWIS